VIGGARFLTASYQPAYAGANGPILSRGAMTAAAIAKASSSRPQVVGKPSRAALAAIADRLGAPTRELAVIGDDVSMDIALGRMGGARTILVRSGISGPIDLARLSERRRPDAVVEGVADLLNLL
jgi:NagD protein